MYSRPCPVLYQLRPGQLGFAAINHTIDERNPKVVLETCDPLQAQGVEALMVEGQVGQTLSADLDQGLKAYSLRYLPELPSGRRSATEDHPTILGQYQ